jgi:predicted adenylyl cyclase CyaB
MRLTMAREIELKIRLADPESFRNRLAKKALAEEPYHKIDTYFRGPKGSFRLREANGLAVVCRKEKNIESGVEVNRETEFQIDDVQAFRQFSLGLGYREWYRKEKIGQAWRWGEILIEEGEVSDLGWFAEFELLLGEESEKQAVLLARSTLLTALDDLEVPRSSIEARTYSQLLGHRG